MAIDKKFWKNPALAGIAKAALEEDLGGEDITTTLTVPASCKAKAKLVSREAGVAAGLPMLPLVFGQLDSRVRISAKVSDGDSFGPNAVLAEISGPARPILTGERVALNFLQRLCGIATAARAYVEAVKPSKASVLDTRKTTPGLRLLEKYAVACGGGQNHRKSLAEAILIKDNHIQAAGSLSRAIAQARQYAHGMPIEVEVENLAQLEEALAARVEWVLLDNMSPALLKQAVNLAGGRCGTEASGNVTLQNVAEVARTGVDRISVGALTHSVKSIDLSLEVDQITK
jgi:nicotinate-nucleotide pyrophosphorylase (carboxylating)